MTRPTDRFEAPTQREPRTRIPDNWLSLPRQADDDCACGDRLDARVVGTPPSLRGPVRTLDHGGIVDGVSDETVCPTGATERSIEQRWKLDVKGMFNSFTGLHCTASAAGSSESVRAAADRRGDPHPPEGTPALYFMTGDEGGRLEVGHPYELVGGRRSRFFIYTSPMRPSPGLPAEYRAIRLEVAPGSVADWDFVSLAYWGYNSRIEADVFLGVVTDQPLNQLSQPRRPNRERGTPGLRVVVLWVPRELSALDGGLGATGLPHSVGSIAARELALPQVRAAIASNFVDLVAFENKIYVATTSDGPGSELGTKVTRFEYPGPSLLNRWSGEAPGSGWDRDFDAGELIPPRAEEVSQTLPLGDFAAQERLNANWRLCVDFAQESLYAGLTPGMLRKFSLDLWPQATYDLTKIYGTQMYFTWGQETSYHLAGEWWSQTDRVARGNRGFAVEDGVLVAVDTYAVQSAPAAGSFAWVELASLYVFRLEHDCVVWEAVINPLSRRPIPGREVVATDEYIANLPENTMTFPLPPVSDVTIGKDSPRELTFALSAPGVEPFSHNWWFVDATTGPLPPLLSVWKGSEPLQLFPFPEGFPWGPDKQ